MTTVPLGAASVFAQHRGAAARADRSTDDEVSRLLQGAVCMVGSRPEVDLSLLRDQSPALADDLSGYMDRCRRVWAATTQGVAGTDYLLTRRALACHTQKTGKADRRDLTEPYSALAEMAGIGEILEEATAAVPQMELLAQLATAFSGVVTTLPDGTLQVELELPGVGGLPDCLGGPPWPGEVRRTVRLGIRHAAWRDRRVRRLCQVGVDVDEMWADPALDKGVDGAGSAPAAVMGWL